MSNKNKDRIVIHTRNLLYSDWEDWDTTCVVKVALRLNHSRELFWLKSDYPGDKLAMMQKIVKGHIEYYPKTFDVSIRDYLGDTQYKFRIVVNVEGVMPRLPLNETVFHYFGIRVYGSAVLVEVEEMEKLKTRRKMMNNADEKMKDDFYDWLNECPVNWVRLNVNDETIHYAFETPDEKGNDES